MRRQPQWTRAVRGSGPDVSACPVPTVYNTFFAVTDGDLCKLRQNFLLTKFHGHQEQLIECR